MSQNLSPLRLPVRTKSGQMLGHVVDVSIDPDTHSVITYHVKASRLVPNVVQSPLMINHSQVVSMSPAGLVVDDNVSRAPNAGAVPATTS